MAIYKYKPDVYHDVLGQFDPVLRISDGDTVITSTVDNAGHDSTDTKVANGINPQTGPFYIEEAEPGDVLSVYFDMMEPNRKIGRASVTIAPNVLESGFTKGILSDRMLYEWEIDNDKGTAILFNPEHERGKFVLPLSPMLGCFGVAPMMNQGIASTTASTHGGNMDYKGFGAGVSVYFPVYVKGGLFFLGDGHAVQGDGEITGMGIECSFDVQFTVKVIKGKWISTPRAENNTYIMTVGNARPLEQALQQATTEMFRWLKNDYKMTDEHIGILFGQCIQYDIGNVFDPAYTVVCKLRKELFK
ncbi:TPA: acetamidase [bacterium]|nr:acetamidase [bacterium]